MKIRVPSTAGFTLVEIMIVVAIIGLLAAMAIPNLTRNREKAQLGVIYNNLRVIDNAKVQWAMENKKGTGDVPTAADIGPYMKNSKFPPTDAVGETYNILPVGQPPTATTRVKIAEFGAGDTITAP